MVSILDASAIATDLQQGFKDGSKSHMRSTNRTEDYLKGFRAGLAVYRCRIPRISESPLQRDDRSNLLNEI